MKFMRNGVHVEAIRYDTLLELKEWAARCSVPLDFEDHGVFIGGLIPVEQKQWVVKGSQGRVYSVSDDTFKKLFTPVDI